MRVARTRVERTLDDGFLPLGSPALDFPPPLIFPRPGAGHSRPGKNRRMPARTRSEPLFPIHGRSGKEILTVMFKAVGGG